MKEEKGALRMHPLRRHSSTKKRGEKKGKPYCIFGERERDTNEQTNEERKKETDAAAFSMKSKEGQVKSNRVFNRKINKKSRAHTNCCVGLFLFQTLKTTPFGLGRPFPPPPPKKPKRL